MAASPYSLSCTIQVVLAVLIFSSLQPFYVSCFEFQVGDKNGWSIPSVNASKNYNDWAAENRFKVGDTLRFEYKKDSVMEVTKEEYKKCNSTSPNFYSNTGNTIFQLVRPGFFYFISGASGHCEKGQRMIVRVMVQEDSPSGGSHSSSSGSRPAILSYEVVQFVLSYLCLKLFY